VIARSIESRLLRLATTFPAVAIVGARQTGKTTLARHAFPGLPYVSLEAPDDREFARTDPRGFLNRFPEGAILDEVQRAPDLFAFLQTVIDQDRRPGKWILTGSHNFLLLGGVSQSLAGRVAPIEILPFNCDELALAQEQAASWMETIHRGFYPEPATTLVAAVEWYAAYVATYVDRDVRSVLNVGDLSTFERFVRLTASRCGSLLNLSSLAVDSGISQPTARSWISVLEASGLVTLLKPHHANFGKRLIKSPKIYWNDTGLLCYLLRITDGEDLSTHPSRGAVFESFVVAETRKTLAASGGLAEPFFWRDASGHEVDLLLDAGARLHAMESKSSETIQADLFRGLEHYAGIAGKRCASTTLIYPGDSAYERSGHAVVPWRQTGMRVSSLVPGSAPKPRE